MKNYENLHPSAQRIFAKTHVRHVNAVGNNERANYQLDQITKVKSNPQENCVEVYFKNGEWFKYFDDGTWG